MKQSKPQAADPPIGSEPKNGQSEAKEPSETTVTLEANGHRIEGIKLGDLVNPGELHDAAAEVLGGMIAREFAAAGQGDAAPAQAKLPGEEWRTPPLWPPFEGHEIERVTLALSGSIGLYGGNEFDRSLAARLKGSARFHLLVRVRCDRLGHVVIRDSKTGADLGREGTAKLAIVDILEEAHLADRLAQAQEQITGALDYLDSVLDIEGAAGDLHPGEARRLRRVRSLLVLGPGLSNDLEAKLRQTAHEHGERAGGDLTDLCECGEQRIDHDEDGHCEAFACKCRSFRPLMGGRTDVDTVTGEILAPAPEGGAPC